MKRFSEQLNKKSTSIKLKAMERRELRERLLSYMEYHPLPAEMKQTKKTSTKQVKPVQTIISEPFVTFRLNTIYLRSVVGVFMVMIIVGVPFIAERSLPGDVLYPVKVQFNEEVRSSLSLSSYAKVEWETERLERRIAEARLLASAGKLTEKVEAEVAEAVKIHSDKAQQEIASLRENDEDEAAIAEIAFASALAVQSEVLEGYMENDVSKNGEGRSVVALAGAVAEAQQAAEASQVGTDPSYEKLLARVELETTNAYELFGSVSSYASAEEVSDIERRLSDIERKVNEAITLHDALQDTALKTPESEVIEELTDDTVEVAAEVATGTEEVVAEAASTTELAEKSPEEEETTVAELELAVVEEVVATEVDDTEAKALLRGALSDARKLISFMTDINVRETVSIEELVPVTLTDDERISRMEDDFKLLTEKKVELESRVVPEFVYKKYIIGEEKLVDLVVEAKNDQAGENYEAAQAKLDEAMLIAVDLYAMTEASQTEIIEEEIIPEVVVEETSSSTEEVKEIEEIEEIKETEEEV